MYTKCFILNKSIIYIIKTIKNTDSMCMYCEVNYIFPLYGCKLQTVTIPNQNWCLRIDAVI